MKQRSLDYHEYLASREWALLRERVRERSGGVCERCARNPMDAVHHLTYARVGRELLTDLQAICDPCHEFLSGKTDNDPASNGTSEPAHVERLRRPDVTGLSEDQLKDFFREMRKITEQAAQ
jgi:5-methylcytosine-specific restriction endonuclease McrA